MQTRQMDKERHRRAKAIFLAALEHGEAGRASFLANMCDGDDALIQEVESLLSQVQETQADEDINHLERLGRALTDRYEIKRSIGRGGMAIVYLAQDLKHKRQVAIKVLLPDVARSIGSDRFLREVSLTAKFNHPHILPLLDSGDADGLLYYVMPFAEGESLRQRLTREKQLPIEDAVSITTAAASALDYAHRHGAVHRDVKPENILLHDGQPVVADFGIALATSGADDVRLTSVGQQPGTPSYMSPEQLAGDRELDGRSDIFALACVTYEMLVGHPPIPTLMADNHSQNITSKRPTVPPHVAQAINSALAILPADRPASAALFAEQLNTPQQKVTQHKALSPGRGPLALAALLVMIGLWGWVRPRGESIPPVVQYRMTLPFEARLDQSGNGSAIALSPDGARLVYVGPGTKLWYRNREDLDPNPIPGTEGAVLPFVSPNGSHVAYFDPSVNTPRHASLRLVSLEGGPPTVVVDSGVGATGGVWAQDNVIYMDDSRSRIVRVSLPDGAREIMTELDVAAGERAHRWPTILPNEKALLFTVVRGANPAEWSIAAIDLETRERKAVAQGVLAKYSGSGHLIIVAADGTLMAAAFDQRGLALEEAPRAVAQNLQTPFASVTLSATGRLAYVTARSLATENSLLFVSRDGSTETVAPEWLANFRSVTVSSDGTHIAASIAEAAGEQIWIKPLGDGAPFKLTLDGNINARPRWLPDASSVLFSSNRAGDDHDLYVKPADGSAAAAPILSTTTSVQEGLYAPDGNWLVYHETTGPSGNTLKIIAPRPELVRAVLPLADSSFEGRSPAISKDGRWLAFVSTRDGRPNVYVQPFPNANDIIWQISADGGQEPVWAHNGRELFYRNGANQLLSAEYTTTPTFSIHRQTALFDAASYAANSYYITYDVTPDDRRFIMIRYGDWVLGELVVIENVFSVLRRGTAPQ